MSVWLVAAVTFAYAMVAVQEAMAGRLPMAVVWGGYALANIGMMGVMLKL